jgi:hypothetical protein
MKHEHSRISDAPLDAADVGAVYASLEGEILLRPTSQLPPPSHIEADLAPDVHATKPIGLITTGLHTMSLNFRGSGVEGSSLPQNERRSV